MCLALVFSSSLFAQSDEDKYAPLTLKLSEDGKKFVRFITWHQIWFETSDIGNDSRASAGNDDNVNEDFNIGPRIRRSRVLLLAKFSPKFLLLTHFGINNLTSSALTPLGTDSPSSLFLHDAWGEYQVGPWLYIGAGLHYWNGLNRNANASTLNLLTLDASRPFAGWHGIGYTSQFARHLGFYLKGAIEKFDYRLAYNSAAQYTSFNNGVSYGDNTDNPSTIVYGSQHRPTLTDGTYIINGYFRYNIFDKESTTLPYAVGTYLGGKKILAVGAGFFAHPSGARDVGSASNVTSIQGGAVVRDNTSINADNVDVFHFSVDVFGDLPLGDEGSGGALTFYVAYTSFNYGENYVARWGGTGHNIYGHGGYLLPPPVNWLQGYFGYQIGMYDGLDEPVNALNVGLNFLINKHHAKVTLEYHEIQNQIGGAAENDDTRDDVSQLRLQLHFFI